MERWELAVALVVLLQQPIDNPQLERMAQQVQDCLLSLQLQRLPPARWK